MKSLFILLFLTGFVSSYGQNPLIDAINSKNYALAQKTIEKGTNIDQPIEVDNQKMTFLSYACLQGDVEMVQLFLKKGALVTPITEGKDALMYAAQGGNREIIELLLNKGASVMNESKEGLTARDYARKAGHQEIEALLASEMKIIMDQARAKRGVKK